VVPWLMVPFSMPLNVKTFDAWDAESVRVRAMENARFVKWLGLLGSTALRPMLDVRLMDEEPVAEPLAASRNMTLLVPPSAAKTSGMACVLYVKSARAGDPITDPMASTAMHRGTDNRFICVVPFPSVFGFHVFRECSSVTAGKPETPAPDATNPPFRITTEEAAKKPYDVG